MDHTTSTQPTNPPYRCERADAANHHQGVDGPHDRPHDGGGGDSTADDHNNTISDDDCLHAAELPRRRRAPILRQPVPRSRLHRRCDQQQLPDDVQRLHHNHSHHYPHRRDRQ